MAIDYFNLDGFVAIVTGASRGIGYDIAQALAHSGAAVYGIARSQKYTDIEAVFVYRACDITKTDEFAALLQDIFAEHGRIDILVNAAGITLPFDAEGDPSVAFMKTLKTNLVAAFECCRQIVPFMLRGGYGSIINVTSIGAVLGFPGNPGYVASKGGLAAMTRAMALDYGTDGIRVNNLVPGYIHTAMTEASFGDPKRREARAARTMLGRWGRPEELAGAAVFLASRASSYVTGSDIFVDGGWSAKGL